MLQRDFDSPLHGHDKKRKQTKMPIGKKTLIMLRTFDLHENKNIKYDFFGRSGYINRDSNRKRQTSNHILRSTVSCSMLGQSVH
jgi:hypothetical protein